MIKSIKKIGLIASSLALSSTFALGVLFMQGNTALADTTATTTTVTLNTEDLFKGDSASIIAPATTFGDFKAVKLSAPYKRVWDETQQKNVIVDEIDNGAVSFNGVFTGKTSIEYVTGNSYSGFSFDVYNTDGTDLIFNFVRVWANSAGTNYKNGLGYIGYDDDAPADAPSGDKVDGVKNYASATTTWAGPKNEGGRTWGNAVVPNVNISNAKGEFVINEVGNDDILKIDVTKANSATVGDCSLQELVSIQLNADDADALREGYTIKYRHLSASTEGTKNFADTNVTNIGIISINEVSLAETTVNATANTTVSYAYEDNGVIELNKGTELGVFDVAYTNKKVGSLKIADTTDTAKASETFADKGYGEYIANVLGKEFTIKVVKPITTEATSVISGTGVKVEYTTYQRPAYTNPDGGSVTTYPVYTGVKVTPDENIAIFNGVFKGSNTIEYLRLDQWGGVAFDVCDLQGNRIFSVMNRWRDAGASTMSAVYNGTYHFVDGNTEKTYTSTKYEDGPYLFLPNYDMKLTGTLTFTPNADGTFSLYAPSRNNPVGHTVEVATIPLSVEHQTAIAKGYTLQIRRTNKDLDGFKTDSGATCLLTAINGVSLVNETAVLDAATETITAGHTITEDKINLVVGDEYVKPTAKVTKARMGGFYLNDYAIALTGNNDVDTTKAGETQITVSAQRESLSYTVNVQTLSAALTGVTMENGAWIRVGSKADNSDRGLGFRMLVDATAQETLRTYVGEGKAYTAAYYGMVIMPKAYADENAVTAENLFGANAAYTWTGKETTSAQNAKMILQMESASLLENGTFFGAITQIHDSNVKKEFIGVGYIKLQLADGSFEYLVMENYSVRTVYEVAQRAYEDVTITDGKLKQWLLDNYLTPNGYKA